MSVEPYLFFNGRCEEALTFYEYEQAFGARIERIARFRESPAPPTRPLPKGWGEKIMHASFLIGDARILLSDADTDAPSGFQGFALSVNFTEQEQARRVFERLAEGGRIDMPAGPSFFASLFGMVTDGFGVQWLVIVPRQDARTQASPA